MSVALPFEEHLAFGPDDDHLHPPGPDLDWTETTWWSSNVPERALAGWLYAQVRPNLGTCAGGAFVYDPTAFLAWDLPYYAWTSHDRLPASWDFDAATFRNGVRVVALEPGMRYEIGYAFRDQRDFRADLVFEGLTAPVPHLRGAPPFVGSSHYDQHGRVTGTLELRGERIPVDCFAVRDRSWGRRPELLGRVGRLSYAFGTTAAHEAFLVFCAPPADDHLCEVETSNSGYLLSDGVLRRLASGERRNVRDEVTNAVRRIEISALDSDGRTLHTVGTARSAMALPTSHVTINTFVEWEMATGTGWGEDQDVWPLASLGDRRHRRPPAAGWS